MEACYAQSLVTVPIYETLSTLAMLYLFERCHAVILIRSNILSPFTPFADLICSPIVEENVVHILNEAEVKAIVCAKDKLDKVRLKHAQRLSCHIFLGSFEL